MYTHETYEYKDFIIEIVPDQDPFDPREDYENLGTMVCWHKRLVLGDDMPNRLKERFNTWNINEISAFKRWKNINQKHLLILPLYLYNHSGITVSTKPFWCPWDSGQIGWIYATHAEIKRVYEVEEISPKVIESATQRLLFEVKIYDDYITGNVWGYLIKDKTNTVLDRCFGYWGYEGQETCLDDAKEVVKALV